MLITRHTKMNFVIITKILVTEEMMADCHATLRGDVYILDNLVTSSLGNVILKWRGDKPESLSEYTSLDENEIKSALKNDEWSNLDDN